MEAVQDGGNPLQAWSERIADLVESLGRHVVAVHAGRHETVTGLVWRAGAVVTVAHALPRASDILLSLPGGASAKAQLAGADGSTDLAVLRIEDETLEPVTQVDDAGVRTGNWVLAVARGGHGDVAVDHGLIGRVGPAWQTWRGGRIDRLIRLDGGLGAGFSGAPIADARGRVIGIGTSALARGYGIVIPATTIGRVSEELLAKGRIARGYLGIGTQPVTLVSPPLAELARKLELDPAQGLLISSIAEGGPAEKAGWLIGDILLELGEHKVSDIDTLQAALASDRVGRELSASVARGGVLIKSAVTVGERPRRHC
ncbi:MAG TPA: trypsin-like peptidase domain-containing protein [Burkholderiaceae bacterium]|nr:trypsin-like peptidase domain-containing protein [Burkholderiaceae bacterium]